ncbi:MAG: DUF1080 domain-containing protein [Gammaproteobacteria bacterium]|nr:DUF1080 domain-containing protein [Gammaproteobacteria bacterium]
MISPLIALLSICPVTAIQDASFEAPDLNFETMDNVNVSLFAESPMLFNPTAMDVDDQGRVWVCEGVNYRQWRGKNPGRHHDEGDRIMVLQDTTGDGVADSSTVFVQDKDLTAPLGIAVIGGDVYVSCSPNLFIYRDLDGDLKADEREVFLTGFGGFDHDHGLHSVVEHPSGNLLWCAGNAGPHLVEDKSGFDLRSGSMYNGGGPAPAGNNPGLVSDDGRVWTGGLIGSILKNGEILQVLAHNFRNEYEVAVDSFGLMYTFDNDDDGNQGCRAVCLTPGGDYGYFGSDGTRTWQADRREGMETFAAHWHQADPGVMPAGTQTGAGGPCGVTVYEHSALPELAGHLLAADAGRSTVFRLRPDIQGAQVVLEQDFLIRPGLDEEGNRGHWFRPSDVMVGPKGEIYVADWYDPGVGGHAAGDRKAYGRILRIDADTNIQRPKLVDNHQTVLTQAKEVWRLSRERSFPLKVKAALQGPLAFAFNHKDERIRLAALEACVAKGMSTLRAAELYVSDPSALVRAHAVANLRDVPWHMCEEVLVQFAVQYDGTDRTYLEAVGIGSDGKETQLYLALLNELDPAIGRAQFRDLAWRLHPAAAFGFLSGEAIGAGVNVAMRRKALDAIAFMPERQAAEFMVSQALAGANDIRGYAATWVRNRSTNLWSEYGLTGSLGGEFEAAEVLWRSELLTDKAVEATVDVRDVSTLWLVVEDGGNGNGYDWAAWLAPSIKTASGSIDLKEIAWTRAKAGWGSPHWSKNCNGGPLLVNQKPFSNGIGTHAPSQIEFALPKDAETLTFTCAPDDGGRQGSAKPSIRFAIYGEKRVNTEDQRAQRLAAVGGDENAAKQLLDTTSGALYLLDQAREDKLPASLRTMVGKRLQEHEDLAVRALASEIFPLTTTSGIALPPLAELAALDGNESNGRDLFRGRGTCSACHRFEGLGGSIGPDLTAIHQKYDRSGILDALLHPSAAMAFGYDNWTLKLKDGSTRSGSILADGDSIVLRDLSGQRSVIAASDVTSRHKSAVSTMPSALALGLEAQDLADLASLMTSDPNEHPEYGPTVELFNGKDLTGWDFFLNNGGQRDDVWSVTDGVLRCEGRPAGYIYTQQHYTNFELTLEWRGDPTVGPGNSGVLLRVQEPHKTWPLSIEAQLQSRSAGDIWNIDKFPMLTDQTRTSGRHTTKLLPTNEKPLGEWNHYRIVLDHSRLTLTVNGQVQNTALWCKELSGPIGLQSEGVPIEFRNVRLREIR